MSQGQKIRNKKSGKVFTIVGSRGCHLILKDQTGRKFEQAMFAVQRDYTVEGQ